MCSRKWLIVTLVACALASACSDYNTNLSIQTSSSVLTYLSPSSATAGSQGFTITANGSGFVTGALILWNGTALSTTLVSGIQLTAPVPASLLATAGTVQVSVQIPGSAQSGTTVGNTTTTEISDIVYFTISPASGTPPAITSLSASTTMAASTPYCSSQGFTLTVNGTNFTSDSVVNWNGAPQTMLSRSATVLTASIPAAIAAFPGTVAVTVTNSIGTSASKSFTLSTPAGTLAAPVIGSLSQTSGPAGGPALALTVTGTNLLPCSTVQWVSAANVTTQLPTTYVSATQLNATVPASDFLAAGTAQLNVTSIGPGGGTSLGISFTIVPPSIASASSSSTNIVNSIPSCSASGFTLTVTGANFVNGSVVDWNGSPRATTFVSSTQLTASISAADIASASTASITVSNSGVLSNSVPFTVSPTTLPASTISSISPVGATAGTAAFPLVVTGTNFVPCSSVQWVDPSNNVTQLVTSYVSPTQLSATVAATNLTTVETVQVSVANPAVSATVSNAIAFPIALPTITSLSASSTMSNSTPACSEAGITLTVNGTNFVPNGLTVNWNGSPRATTFVSATQLTAAISAVDTAFPGPANITVSSTTIPSLASAAAAFTIAASTTPLPTPVITTLLPSNAAAGSPAFTLGVDGSGSNGGTLSPCSVVQWNGTAVPTTFNSSTGLNAGIPATDVAAAASIPVTVFTLTAGGGGGTSNALTFTVFTPPMAAAHIDSPAQFTQGSVLANSGLPLLPAPTMSSDQRYTVSVLASTDGVTQVPGTPENIFVKDTCTGGLAGCQPSVTNASIGFNSNPADGDSISPSISADGRYVVFLSSAMDLVDSDTNGVMDVFVRDTCAGAAAGCKPSTQRVSVASDGTQANGASTSATVSATGRYVTFESTATNLGAASSGSLFLRDTCAGASAACTPSTAQLQ